MKSLAFYRSNIYLLKNLFGETTIEKYKARLEEIFIKTEQDWAKRVDGLKGKKVKYLLICEAPPYSEEGDPWYF